MDIYFGSSQKIQEEQKKRFHRFISLNEFLLDETSGFINLLKHKTGESLIINHKNLEIVFDGYIPGFLGVLLEKHISELADNLVNQSTIDFNKYNGIFNICVRDKNSGDIFLTSDPSALLPLNYSTSGGVFYYCSHLHIIGSVLNAEPDFAGIAQKDQLGYTLGARTLYKDIYRLNPGETVIFRSRSARSESICFPYYYTDYKEESNIEEILYKSLGDSFKEMRTNYSTIGLMLSEGFDSRFLGGLAKNAGFKINSFTHGTPGTHGQKVVEKASALLNSNHHFHSLTDGYPVDPGQLEKQLYLADNLNYPYWIHGSNYFSQINADYPVIIGSSLDCTLGGNIFFKPMKPIIPAVTQRYSEILRQGAGLLSNYHIERLAGTLISAIILNSRKNYSGIIADTYNPEIGKILIRETEGIEDHIKTEFNRLSSSGSFLQSQQLQRFTLENRDRKLFFGQPLTMRVFNKIYIPSFEYGFMNKVSSVQPSKKLHHKLYINILRKFLPEQLRIENGAYGLPPFYPRLILETARFYHKQKEKQMFTELLRSRGDISPSNFRAVSVSEYFSRSDSNINGFEKLIEYNKYVLNTKGMKLYLDDVRHFKTRIFNFERFYRSLEVSQVLKHNIK